MRLAKKVAIITGGGRGIGCAVAEAFANEGCVVAVVGRTKAKCDETAALITGKGGSAIGIQANVTNESDVKRMVTEAERVFGRIDVLVNCAGANLPYREVKDITLDDWNLIVGTNLTGTFLCSREVLPVMMKQRSGKIINISSLGGRVGAAGRSAYRASKAAVINFTQSLAGEVKEHGIDVNAVCPAQVVTDMLQQISGGSASSKAMPPEDIAAVIVFLASDESRAITGTAIDAFGPRNPVFVSTSSAQPSKS